MFLILGQFYEGIGPNFAMIEVTLSKPSRKAKHTICVTGYRNGQVGERSVGMNPSAAREVALLLSLAADRADLAEAEASKPKP